MPPSHPRLAAKRRGWPRAETPPVSGVRSLLGLLGGIEEHPERLPTRTPTNRSLQELTSVEGARWLKLPIGSAVPSQRDEAGYIDAVEDIRTGTVETVLHSHKRCVR